MKSNTKLAILLFVLVAVVLALLQAGQKQPVDWRKTFNPADKIPYGTYVLHNELKNLYNPTQEVTDVNQSLYEFLKARDSSLDSSTALLFIGNDFNLSETGKNTLFSYVNRGGTVFISASWLGSVLYDQHINYTRFNYYKIQAGFDKVTATFSLYKYKDSAKYDKLENAKIFNALPKQNTTILGNAKLNETTAANFIQYKQGKGSFYLHLAPEVFSNYYVLNDTTFPIAMQSLQYLKGKHIYWYDEYYDAEQSRSVIRFILSKSALRWAWFLVLILLLIYIVFQSRREQRAIPIQLPEPNRSVDFAKTIGSLYYENGSPGNMVQKKIDYFLFGIRQRYRLDTEDVLDPKFIRAIQQRTGINEIELKEFFGQVARVQGKEQFSEEDLKYINKIILQFKKEAKMD